jgi:hypothetical protein
MRTSRHILICGIVSLVASCAAAPDPPNQIAESVTTHMNSEECRANGGTIRNVCRLQLPACVVPFADGGKRCTDSRQCKGKCLLDTETDRPLRPGDYADGRCQRDNDPCGCKIEVMYGKVESGVCVD